MLGDTPHGFSVASMWGGGERHFPETSGVTVVEYGAYLTTVTPHPASVDNRHDAGQSTSSSRCVRYSVHSGATKHIVAPLTACRFFGITVITRLRPVGMGASPVTAASSVAYLGQSDPGKGWMPSNVEASICPLSLSSHTAK